MSNSVKITLGEQVFSGNLILTAYGQSRVLQRLNEMKDSILEDNKFTPFHINEIVLGNKINNSYTSNITLMGNEMLFFDITDDNITVDNGTARIRTELEIESEIAIQEIGLFENINGSRRMFAYASGFSMIKSTELSYNLIVDLEMNLTAVNVHYDNYEISLGEHEYALAPEVPNLWKTITDIQLDLERCIEKNAKEIGYFKPQLFFEKQKEMSDILNNSLLTQRYTKVIHKVSSKDMTDCFYYPTSNDKVYDIRNLQDEESVMNVNSGLQLCNKDNIDLSKAASIVITAKLGTLTKNGVIIGKMDPNRDEYYFDLRIVDNALQFTIYCYDRDSLYAVNHGSADEFKLVGHYRIKYKPSESTLYKFIDGEAMLTFLYNGNIDNPKVRMFIGLEELLPGSSMSEEDCLIEDNFNYMGPCKYFKDTTTLRNYTQTVNTSTYEDPMIYLLPHIEITTFLAFSRELTTEEITYLSAVDQS